MKIKNKSIYAPPNKYGYEISINHPKIGAIILSDEERFQFENIIKEMIERKKKGA